MSKESKRKAPAFQLYTDDFLAGTLEMSQEEVGQFIRLLCHQWNRGWIPVETEKQQRLTGGCVSVDVLVKFRLCEDGFLRNERLESVRTERGIFLQQQSKKGQQSAEKRRLAALEIQPDFNRTSTEVQPDGQPTPQPESNSPSPSPSPKKERQTVRSEWELIPGVELPDCFRTQNCLEATKLWLQYKTEKRETYKKTGLTMTLTKWSNEFTPAELPSAIERSIANGWKGLYPNDKSASKQSNAPRSDDKNDIRNYL